MHRRNFLLSVAAASVAAQCHSRSALAERLERIEPSAIDQEVLPGDAWNPGGIRLGGIRMLPVVNGKYKVWTKRVGKGSIKLLVLHGGPGGNHVMLGALAYFLPEAGVEVYFYDQLGCGYSDRPDDMSLWTVDRYVEEVEEVRRGLGLDNFILYGHSWGGFWRSNMH
jgi:proline iminopeptidase